MRQEIMVPTSPPAPVTRITEKLAEIEREHGVVIPIAIESGSRAWGFPSPDSDYDCRFIYVRPFEDYLSLWPKRDVIELPLEGDLDINGWDLGKALKLILKGNAVVIEWLTSPITYQADPAFREALLAFATRTADRALIGRHYLHLGERQRRTYFADETAVAQKKIFYALRPAATLRWLRMHPDARFTPMNFLTLWSEIDPPADSAEIVADLIIRKAQSRELGTEPLPKPVRDFIDSEFASAREHFSIVKQELSAEAMAEADALFLSYAKEASRS